MTYRIFAISKCNYTAMNNRFFFLFYIFVAYVLAASLWWAYLLYDTNGKLYQAKIELYQTKFGNMVEDNSEYQALLVKRDQQRRMILGEGIVYFALLVLFLLMVMRSVKREMELTQQQRNFILSITHELKSPLAAIRIAVETMLRRDLALPQRNKLCSNAIQDVERLGGLVDNVLLAARVESASYEPKKVPIDMGDFLDGLVQDFLMRFPDTEITLEERGEFVPFIEADRHALTSIMLNLVENAVKYNGTEAIIKVIMTTTHPNAPITIAVADNGWGVSDENKLKIFEKFYRVGNEDTRRTKGTGLGLYIVKELIRLHGGSIKVSDNTPKGSIFTITLPPK
jgi:signal transduction histidine kinase